MYCVISGEFLRQKDKQKCITCLESRDPRSHKRRQRSSTWPAPRLEYLPAVTARIMAHSIGARLATQSAETPAANQSFTKLLKWFLHANPALGTLNCLSARYS